MPYKKLIAMEKFSKLRIKQLFDDCRIFAAWLSSIRKGRILRDRKTGKIITASDAIDRYAHARGLLWALGFTLKIPGPETTTAFKIMFKRALPNIKKWYNKYRDKVKRGS